jgi:flagellar biosynthesis GTPase FlhF
VVPDEPSQSLNKFLQRCGFDEALLCDLFSSNDWRAWEFLPLNEAILKVVARFRESYLAQFKKKLTPRMAFIGPPGAGTTTVLCKLLSQAVFLKGEKPQVLKWDSDGPNANEALEVFCEVLGVKWYRDPVDRPHLVLDQPLYMDVPGLPLDHPDWPILMKTLDDLAIDTRIFIMNGLYEKDYLQKAYVLAEQLKTTHLVFTHLDEVLLATKLWRFLFRKNITVLGFSHGQSLTGTFSDDPLEWLLSATF